MPRRISAILAGTVALFLTSALLADVPEYGTVVEGQSVPGGLALGSTRASVEAAYGPPTRCQSVQNPRDAASCTWIRENYVGQGGQVQSQVTARFRGPDGNSASDDPNDVVANASWYGLDGWVTTRGVNALFAADNQDAVIALYPNGIVSDQSLFDTILTAYEDGFSVAWHTEYLTGSTSVRLSIFEPRDPPPPREPTIVVSEITMDIYKRQVTGQVRVLNDLGWQVPGVDVFATWTLPDGSTLQVTGTTDGFGLAYLAVDKARRGTYTLTIDTVELEDHTFDADNSVLGASIFKRR